jgi:PrcB C-terminal
MLAGALGIIGPPLRSASAPSTPAPAQSAPSIRQWHGAWGGGNGFYACAIRNARAWKVLWERMRRSPPCQFDPASTMGVFIALGTRPTGGYRVDVVSASAVNGRLVVRYRELGPSRTTYVIEAITHPWAMALLPRSNLPVDFRPVGSSR